MFLILRRWTIPLFVAWPALFDRGPQDDHLEIGSGAMDLAKSSI